MLHARRIFQRPYPRKFRPLTSRTNHSLLQNRGVADRCSPEVNFSVLLHLPKLHFIKVGDNTHGIWPILPAIDTDPSTTLVESLPERQYLTAYWKHTSNLYTRLELTGWKWASGRAEWGEVQRAARVHGQSGYWRSGPH